MAVRSMVVLQGRGRDLRRTNAIDGGLGTRFARIGTLTAA
jgi:hypothetical protein